MGPIKIQIITIITIKITIINRLIIIISNITITTIITTTIAIITIVITIINQLITITSNIIITTTIITTIIIIIITRIITSNMAHNITHRTILTQLKNQFTYKLLEDQRQGQLPDQPPA